MSKPVTDHTIDKITLRIPRHLHQSLRDLAIHKGTSVNAEILTVLLQQPIEDRLDHIGQVTIELKTMVKEILESVAPPR